jgi:capsular polysaccharide biosynthesis protein
MNKEIVKYIRIALSRMWILLALAVAAAATAYIACDREFVKKYEASMKLIITLGEVNDGYSVYDSIRSSQMAAGDLSQIIISDAVLARVEEECRVDRQNIIEALKVEAVPNTRILNISVETDTPEGAVKLVESLDKNLSSQLKEIDGSITYKILSRPHLNNIPVNQAYPVLMVAAAAFGGLLLGILINLALGGKQLENGGLEYVHSLFEEENILLVPAAKKPGQEGGLV